MSEDQQWHDISNLIGEHCQSILDIGCGDGQTLKFCPHVPFRAGIDISPRAIELAQKSIPDGHFQLSAGESLPFEDDRFDAVVSCVALPYMDIPVVLKECARIMRPSGKLLVSIHDWEFLQFLWKNTPCNLAGKVFRAYVALNGFSYHLFGKLFRYPLRPSMMESYQTEAALRKSLSAAGFHQVTRLDRRVPSFVAIRD
jgi:ubiquinone/menaquinone biosynthesis C-methylase UbiE